MLGHHSIKDPSFQDTLHEQQFAVIDSAGNSVADAIAYCDDVLTLLGEARVDLFSETAIERNNLAGLRKCTHAQLRKDLLNSSQLHPRNPWRNWQYLPGILKRIANADLRASLVAADLKAMTPSPPPQPKQPKGGPPPASPLTTDAATGAKRGKRPPQPQ